MAVEMTDRLPTSTARERRPTGSLHRRRALSARTPVDDDERVRALVADLAHRGVVLRIEGGLLRWRAPSGAMTVDLLRRVKQCETELMTLLIERVEGSR